MSGSRGAVAPSVSLVAAAACWGTAAVISKRAVDEIDPLTLLPIELMVSVIVLAIVASVRHVRLGDVRHVRFTAALGVLNPGLSYALSLAGLARVTASTSVLLWAVEPVLIIAFAYLLFRQRVSRSLALFAGMALAGVVLIVFRGGGGVDMVGVVLTVAGVAACALYTVLSSRLTLDNTVAVVTTQQAAALLFAVVLFAGTIPFGSPQSLGSVSAAGWISAVVAGALYYGVAFCFYLAGLKRVSPGYAGLFITLVPLFGVSVSAAFLGERLSERQWVGAAMIIVAITLAAALQARTDRRAISG